MKNFILLLMLSAVTMSCQSGGQAQDENQEVYIEEDLNYPADGFDIEGSDPVAILIADRVMKAMGGRKAWDNTRYLSWNFFGSRKLLWDKHEGKVRIENQRSDEVILLDINEMTGKVFKDGMEMTNPDSLTQYLDRGKRIWINDSYWLVMPFKMKDSGVTLKLEGEGETEAGERCDIVRLSFYDVGVTPDNSYLVWVSMETDLVKQWAYFREFSDSEPSFVRPWDNYKKMGDILLSDERGDRDLTEVQVLEDVPDGIFSSFEVTL